MTNIVGASTMATFDVAVDADAELGTRTLGVVTPDGRSNRIDVPLVTEIIEPTAPTISNLSLIFVVQRDDSYVFGALFDWADPNGDLTWSGDIANSAKAEVRVSGAGEECFFLVGGPMILNFPGSTTNPLSQLGFASPGGAGQAPIQPGAGMVSVTLIDAAQNRSNTLTIDTTLEPAPGACDPNVSIDLLLPATAFLNP